jgi:hypothetical protein
MRPNAARHHRHWIWLSALLIAGPAAVVSAAGHGSASPEPITARHARLASLTLDQAIEMAERRFRARVVRAGVEEADGQRIYVLRLLSEQGRVWTVRVDAQSGSVN